MNSRRFLAFRALHLHPLSLLETFPKLSWLSVKMVSPGRGRVRLRLTLPGNRCGGEDTEAFYQCHRQNSGPFIPNQVTSNEILEPFPGVSPWCYSLAWHNLGSSNGTCKERKWQPKFWENAGIVTLGLPGRKVRISVTLLWYVLICKMAQLWLFS